MLVLLNYSTKIQKHTHTRVRKSIKLQASYTVTAIHFQLLSIISPTYYSLYE